MQAKRQRLNRTQIGECLKLFDENGTVLDGLYKYNEGWDDYRLGEHFKVDRTLIGSLRRETRGKLWSEAKLIKANGAPTQPELPFGNPELDQLREEIADMQAVVRHIYDTLQGLLATLGEPTMSRLGDR